MYKLTPLQKETMEFLKAQIDEARSHSINFENMGKEDYANTQKILEVSIYNASATVNKKSDSKRERQ